MKKSAIALAVIGALGVTGAAHAETTFYGRISSAIVRIDPDASGPENEERWDVIASGSRWGVKASEDLGNGLKAFARLETAINSGEYNGNSDGQTGRLAYVGLSGGFGELQIGTLWGVYYEALGAADIFNEANWYTFYSGPFRINNAIRYDSPDLGGFSIGLAAVVDGDVENVLRRVDTNGDGSIDGLDDISDNNEEDIDLWQAKAQFSVGPFFIGAGWQKNEETESDQYGLSASFDFAGVSLAAMYEHFDIDGDFDDDGDGDLNNYYLTAQYKIANNILRAGYGVTDPDDGDERDEWAVGFQHSMSSSSRVWIEYQDEEDEGSFMSIGLRKDW